MRRYGFLLRLLLVLVILGFIAITQLLAQRKGKKSVLAKFQGRPRRSPGEFALEFFGPEEGTVRLAERVVMLLQENAPIDLACLEPDDDFTEDLMIPALDKLALGEFFMDLQEKLDLKLPKKPEQRLRTFRQVMDYLEPRVPRSRLP